MKVSAADAGEEIEISVVIPVLDGVDVLGEQIEALRHQTRLRGWEIVVADNGSADGTQDLVRKAAEDFPVSIRLIAASEVTGAAFARNQGARAARGRKLAFCDADDHVAPTWVDAASRGLETADAGGGVLRELTVPFNPDSRILRSSVEHAQMGDVVSGTCNLAVRRDVFFALDGFDSAMPAYGGEDSEFAVRMSRSGARVREIDGMVVYFRRTEAGRAALRKVFLGGVSETVLWQRYPEVYPETHQPRWLLRAIAEFPRVLGDHVRGRNAKGMMRYTVRRLGNIVARYALVRKAPAPRLLHDLPLAPDITRSP